MSTTPTPLPCPFCKGIKIGVHQHKQRRAVGFKAMCLGCGISQTGMAYGSPEQAIAAWNTRAALTQGAGAVEPVAWPRDAAEVRQFMNSNCESVEFSVDEATPDDGDRYQLTAHDFLSAVNWWADFPHYPSEEAAQQLQQAVARAVEECAVICEGMHEEDRPGDYAAAIRLKGTHD